jgi:hypothetical protein
VHRLRLSPFRLVGRGECRVRARERRVGRPEQPVDGGGERRVDGRGAGQGSSPYPGRVRTSTKSAAVATPVSGAVTGTSGGDRRGPGARASRRQRDRREDALRCRGVTDA